MSWNTHIPKFRRFVLQNFPFIEEDFDALTDYALISKVVEYLNNVIQSQNDVITEVGRFETDVNNEINTFETNITNDFNRLEGLFVELKSYVDNYFDNLDVQEEINNKLEQMAEDGTLQEIITAYIQSNVAWTFDSVADMKLATNLVNGSYARTLGFHALNDGGGAIYKITDSGTANEMDVIGCENQLFAVLVSSNEINVDQIGAKGDGTTDDTTILQYALNNYKIIHFSAKTYKCNSGLDIPTNKTLIGKSQHHNSNATVGTVIKGNNTGNGLHLYNAANTSIMITMSGICVENYSVGIYATSCVNSEFTDVMCRHNNIGAIFTGNSYIINFYHCSFDSNTTDGFQTGLVVNNPANNQPIVPNISTINFFGCSFGANGEYGINGWMRVYNFYGGFSENNPSGGVRIYSSNTKESQEVLFSGFDIEFEKYGYVIEGESKVNASYIYIDGGQVAINDDTGAVMLLKGPSCNFTYISNIYLNTRTNITAANTINHIYVEGATGAKSIQCDITTGNRNSSFVRSNLDFIVPNSLLSHNGQILLEAVGGEYLSSDGSTITLPNGKSLDITIPGLQFFDQVTVNTTSSAKFNLRSFGTKTTDFASTINTSGTSENNITTIGGGVIATKLILKNTTGSAVTINGITLKGKFKK